MLWSFWYFSPFWYVTPTYKKSGNLPMALTLTCTFFFPGQVAETIEPIQGLNIKVRRSLKGHNAKVLCIDWGSDKRHLVSSSQVSGLF
jgi:hypothetical protein